MAAKPSTTADRMTSKQERDFFPNFAGRQIQFIILNVTTSFKTFLTLLNLKKSLAKPISFWGSCTAHLHYLQRIKLFGGLQGFVVEERLNVQ